MIDSPNFRMADRLAGGQLADQLLTHRANGLSYNRIAAQLLADHGIEVTGVTVAVWVDQLEVTA